MVSWSVCRSVGGQFVIFLQFKTIQLIQPTYYDTDEDNVEEDNDEKMIKSDIFKKY